MNLLEQLKETAASLTSRKKRDKFITVPSSTPATLIPSEANDPASLTGANMATITFNPGTGTKDRAAFNLGRASVPAAVISRIIHEVEGKNDQRKAAVLYGKLEKKYSAFLEAMDNANLDYVTALDQMVAAKPEKVTGGTRTRVGKVDKTAAALAKGICKRFKGTPEEMVAEFLTVVVLPEFQTKTIELVKGFQSDFGMNKFGFTKSSKRKGNAQGPAAMKKGREAKKK